MGERTGIGWTNHTWNPWHGCTKVSPGCDHCYMYAEKRQYGQDPEVVVRSKTTFNNPLKWRERGLVFTCSWSDFFHVVADPWRDEAWNIIRRTPHLTYQILTKRHGRIERNLPADWGNGYPNVWLGVSGEDQEWYERRWDTLRNIPARVRWVSLEPLLGPIALRLDDTRTTLLGHAKNGQLLDWVVVGGESGAYYRTMSVAWAEDIAAQCTEGGVPLFVKQDSGPKPGQQGRLSADLWAFKDYPNNKELV